MWFCWSLSKICKIVLGYTLKCSQLISSSDNKKILSGWIQATMQQNTINLTSILVLSCVHCTKKRFANLLYGGFTTMAVINTPEWKMEKHTSVHCPFLCCLDIIYQTRLLGNVIKKICPTWLWSRAVFSFWFQVQQLDLRFRVCKSWPNHEWLYLGSKSGQPCLL